VAFGNYNVFTTTATDSAGTITYKCNSQAVNISIALSKGASGTFSPRTLTKAIEALSYNLYLNAGRTQPWGDGTGGTSVYSIANPANNQDVSVPVYGRVPALQDVSAGLYADAIVATINF
jgi:spore coat protein U-like protein